MTLTDHDLDAEIGAAMRESVERMQREDRHAPRVATIGHIDSGKTSLTAALAKVLAAAPDGHGAA